MKVRFTPLALSGMLCLLLSACAGTPDKAAEAKPAETAKAAEPAKPALTAEAQSLLAQAEADAKTAKANVTLWVPAEKALKNAQDAAAKGDSAVVLKEAKKAIDLMKLSAAQPNYPSTEMK